MKKTLLCTAALASAIGIDAQPRLTHDNIDDVLASMTLREKATLVVGSGWGSMIAGMTGSSRILVSGAAGTTREIARLGIPHTVLADGPAGLRINPTRKKTERTFYCTAFPVGTAIASSWDTQMVQDMTMAMGNEVLEYGVDVLLAPGMNIHRNPLCGRNFEYFSEDPVLSGNIASAYVKGIQSNGVGVSLKHFAANNQETARQSNDARVDVRALREIYLRNFEIAVKGASPWTVMSSYNRLNGEFTQQSHDLLTKVLREEWGFDGIVMTDWGSKKGTAAAVHAGNDLMEPGMGFEIRRIVSAVRKGTLSEEELDRSVRRILEFIVKTPRFRGYKYTDAPDLASHSAIARHSASQSMVLLKNSGGTLPLKGVGNIALFGVSSVDFVAGGTGSGHVNKQHMVNLEQGLQNAGFKLDEDLREFYNAHVAGSTRKGSPLLPGGAGLLLGESKVEEPSLPHELITGAEKGSDMAIVVIGRNSGEGADRTVRGDFELSDVERGLLEGVSEVFHKAGKRVVVVLNIGGVIETASWKDIPDAILLCWQGGQEGGDSTADVLTGKVTPSGKLPMTFPVNLMDHPSSRFFPIGQEKPLKKSAITPYSEGIWVGYRYFDTFGVKVSYPFGFGLSYTTFEYSDPVLKATRDGSFTAKVTVTNTGPVEGREVVQVYISAPGGGLQKPSRELKAFGKTGTLAPGQSETLSFTFTLYDLASFNPSANRWESAEGEYKVGFGRNVSDIPLSVSFTLDEPSVFPVSGAWVHTAPGEVSTFSLQKP